MDFKSLLDKLKEANQNDPIMQVSKLMAERVKQQNPNFIGPPVPENTPVEDEYYKNLAGSVAGSLTPVKGKNVIEAGQVALKEVVPEAETLLNRLVPSSAPNSLAMETQKLSRSADFANRNKQQLEALKAIRRKNTLSK